MRNRRLLLLELIALVFLGWGALRWQDPSQAWTHEVLWFALSFLLLELFEVELPRGESSTMSTAVTVVGVLMLPSWAVAASVAVPSLLVHGWWRREAPWGDRAQSVVERLVVLVVAISVSNSTAGWIGNQVTLRAALVALAAVLLDFALTQVRSAERLGTPLLGLVLGSARFQGTLIAAQVSASLLGAVVYQEMQAWAVLVLTMMLMIMRQAFSLFVSVRRAYQSTIEALARTVEAGDPRKVGHSQRVSSLAAEVGRLVGLGSGDLERLAYASLLHDLGAVGEPAVDTESASRLSAADMIGDVGFLSDAVPVLQICEDPTWGLDRGQPQDAVLAYVVLVASRTDDIAQGIDSSKDLKRIAAVDEHIDDATKQRIEMAFRVASQNVDGRLFTITGMEGES